MPKTNFLENLISLATQTPGCGGIVKFKMNYKCFIFMRLFVSNCCAKIFVLINTQFLKKKYKQQRLAKDEAKNASTLRVKIPF